MQNTMWSHFTASANESSKKGRLKSDQNPSLMPFKKIHHLIQEMIKGSKSEKCASLLCPVFLPGVEMSLAFRTTALNGVCFRAVPPETVGS